jgi:ArsR family transcriptional regulator
MQVSPVINPWDRRGRSAERSVAPAPPADPLRLAGQLKALADPTRLRIVDALRAAWPEAICQCELTPLFQISQQALSKHLRTLTRAGVIDSERRGVWTYYRLPPDGLEEVRSWLA